MLARSFQSICGSPLWNHKMVYSSQPDFTSCFQNTVLKWLPCLVLWLAAPLWIYMLTKENIYIIKRSKLLLLKTLAVMHLIIVEIFNLGLAFKKSREHVYYITPFILLSTYLLVLFFIYYEKKRGLRSSTLLFVFWLFMALTNILTVRSKIIHSKKINFHSPNYHAWDTILFFLFYLFVIVNIILSAFTEKAVLNIKQTEIDNEDYYYYDEENKKTELKKIPENSVSMLSRLFFWWINDLILAGYKRPLTRDDLWKIEETESSHYLTKKLETEWNKASRKYIQNLKNVSEESEKTAKFKNSANTKDAKTPEEEIKLSESTDVTFRNGKKIKKPSFAKCLCKVYGGKFLAGSFIKVIQDLLLFVGPLLLDKLINFFKDPEQNIRVGLFYTLLLFLASLTQSFLLQHYFHRMFIVGSRIRT